jgi:hypothetical protein
MNTRYLLGSMALALALYACTDKAENAVEAAKSLTQLGDQAKQLAAAAEKAGAEAEAKAKQQVAPGTDPALAQQQVDMAKSMAALQAMAAAAGPAVNWRDLVPFVPEKLGDFVMHGELDGSSTSMGGAQVSKLSRKYKVGDKSATLTITDAIGAGFLRMPFAMAAMLNEDSTRGFKKGKRIADQPAIVEWHTSTKHSELTMLVAERYVVKIDVRKAETDDEAEKLSGMLDIAGLAKLKPAAK